MLFDDDDKKDEQSLRYKHFTFLCEHKTPYKGFYAIIRQVLLAMIPSRNRIKTSEFPAVTRGKIVQNEHIRVVFSVHQIAAVPRIAVIVPKKIAKKAVERNYLRRLVYSAIGNHLENIPNTTIVIFPKNKQISFIEIEESIKTLICSKK